MEAFAAGAEMGPKAKASGKATAAAKAAAAKAAAATVAAGGAATASAATVAAGGGASTPAGATRREADAFPFPSRHQYHDDDGCDAINDHEDHDYH